MNVIESRRYVGSTIKEYQIPRNVHMPLVTYCDESSGKVRNRSQLTGVERQVTEIDIETNLEYDSVSLEWKISDFKQLLTCAASGKVLTDP